MNNSFTQICIMAPNHSLSCPEEGVLTWAELQHPQRKDDNY